MGSLTTAVTGLKFNGEVGSFTLSGLLGARAALGDRNVTANIGLAAAQTPGNDILAAPADRISANLQLNADYQIADQISFSIGYSGLLGDVEQRHTAKATSSIEF
ncbi:MAG: autotransporter domain-containing protein [Sphingomonadaceae bacterium]|nr:autotransporter domain-containing protein [Sphingomonadaceae bacterium]